MLDTYQRYQIALNLKKCLFYVPFGTLLDHVVCRQGLMANPKNITVILNLEAPRSVKQLRTTLGHNGYYRKFIKAYAQITTPMNKLLKRDVTFCCNEDFKKSLDVLKEKMTTTNSSLPKLEEGVSCTCRRIVYSVGSSTDTEAQHVKDCIGMTATMLFFEYVLAQFGCPKILMSDRSTHFLNETISALMEEFQVYHQKSTPYHPQANKTVEEFNKVLENVVTKVCNAQ
eukprot:PITA_30368